MRLATWIDVGKPTPEILDKMACWIGAWGDDVTHIVGTEPAWVAEVYESPQLKGRDIIPCVKLSASLRQPDVTTGREFLHPLTSPEVWRAYGSSVELACQKAGSSLVLVEMESARNKHYLGFGSAFDARLTDEVRRWMPHGISHILYPPLWGDDDGRERGYEFLDAILYGLEEAELTGFKHAMFCDRDNTTHARFGNAQLQSLGWSHGLTDSVWQIVYLCPPGSDANSMRMWNYGRGTDRKQHFTVPLADVSDEDTAVLHLSLSHIGDVDDIVREYGVCRKR